MAYDTDITKFSDDLNTVINTSSANVFESAPVHRYGGRKRVVSGNFELATTDVDANDIIVLARLPSNAVIHTLFIMCDTLDTGAGIVVDVGIYEPDGTVVDIDAYVDGTTDFRTANAPPGTDYRWSALTDAVGAGDTIWENGGESADPSAARDIAMTVETVPATAVAATLAYSIEYTID